MRYVLAAWLLSLAALISTEGFASPGAAATAENALPSSPHGPKAPGPHDSATEPPALEVSVLTGVPAEVTAAEVTSGALDARFTAFSGSKTAKSAQSLWLRLRAPSTFDPAGIPVLIARGGWFERIEAFSGPNPAAEPLPHVTDLREFGGAHQSVFILPKNPARPADSGLAAGQSLYARVAVHADGANSLRFSLGTLGATLARGADHARAIALAVGALTALALGSLLIWFILADRLFILYTALFLLEAVYLLFFSGEGFDWPVLSNTRVLGAYMWNVPVALNGAVASLFIREIADLKHSSPRTYKIFGWLAGAFVLLAFSNFLHQVGLADIVVAIGNLMFVGAAVFVLTVAFLAWIRGNRAAGWFLIAWTMLETCAIVTAVKLLVDNAEHSERLLYYGLPLSMVAAAVLVALGVADRLRDQRAALSEAEKRAQTDPLTGVLNRRSLIERLDAAGLRARTRGLPIALLFIDLDHFKEINDSFGHAAGDACLHAIIGPIQAELRQSDVIGRYGGEEFVVILSSADITAAHPIAERIRNRVADIRVEGFGTPIRLTCSIGVATSDTLGVWGEHLIAQADAAVYAAKRSGRNCVQVAIAQAA